MEAPEDVVVALPYGVAGDPGVEADLAYADAEVLVAGVGDRRAEPDASVDHMADNSAGIDVAAAAIDADVVENSVDVVDADSERKAV